MRQALSGLGGIYLTYLIRKKEGSSLVEKAFASLRKHFGKTRAKPQRFSAACLVFPQNRQEALTRADFLSYQQRKKNMIGSLWKFHSVGIFRFVFFFPGDLPKETYDINPTDLRILPSGSSSQATKRKAETQASWMNKEPWWFPRQRLGEKDERDSPHIYEVIGEFIIRICPDTQLLLRGTCETWFWTLKSECGQIWIKSASVSVGQIRRPLFLSHHNLGRVSFCFEEYSNMDSLLQFHTHPDFIWLPKILNQAGLLSSRYAWSMLCSESNPQEQTQLRTTVTILKVWL